MRQDVEQVRASLEQAYQKAGAAKDQWKDLDADLQRLEGQLKEGGSKAVANARQDDLQAPRRHKLEEGRRRGATLISGGR